MQDLIRERRLTVAVAALAAAATLGACKKNDQYAADTSAVKKRQCCGLGDGTCDRNQN